MFCGPPSGCAFDAGNVATTNRADLELGQSWTTTTISKGNEAQNRSVAGGEEIPVVSVDGMTWIAVQSFRAEDEKQMEQKQRRQEHRFVMGII